MWLAYITRSIRNNYSAFLRGVKANVGYRTRNLHNNYSTFLLGVKANLFSVVGLQNEGYS